MGMHYVFDAPARASEIVQGVWCGFAVWRRLGVVGLQCRIKSQNPNNNTGLGGVIGLDGRLRV